MLTPRFNKFSISLPSTIIPVWVHDLFVDVLKDDKLSTVYNDPVDCIAESLCGLGLPGIHVKLLEQTHQDAQHQSSYTTYYPKGENAMKVIDDNELALQFRLVDGMHNYAMLSTAIAYMANDGAQLAQGETYKEIGSISVRMRMSDKFEVVKTFGHCVFSSISNISLKYNAKSEESSFDVRIKFVEIDDRYYFDGKCITERTYNHNLGN